MATVPLSSSHAYRTTILRVRARLNVASNEIARTHRRCCPHIRLSRISCSHHLSARVPPSDTVQLIGLTRCCSAAQSGQRDTGGQHRSRHSTQSCAETEVPKVADTTTDARSFPPLSRPVRRPQTHNHPTYTSAFSPYTRLTRGCARHRTLRFGSCVVRFSPVVLGVPPAREDAIASYCARRARHVWRINPVYLRGRAGRTGRRGTDAQLVRLVTEQTFISTRLLRYEAVCAHTATYCSVCSSPLPSRTS